MPIMGDDDFERFEASIDDPEFGADELFEMGASADRYTDPPYTKDKDSRCKCGHERAVHAGHDGLGRCALRSCPTICGEFRRA